MMGAPLPPPPSNHHILSGPLVPIPGSPDAMVMGGDGMRDGPKKRELSQSKRAAQNRAAQVSFPIPKSNIAPLAKPSFFSYLIL